MHRMIAALGVAPSPAPRLSLVAQEPGQTSPPGSNLPELKPIGPEMLMMDRRRQMDPKSPLNGPMPRRRREFLQSGRLTPEVRLRWEELSTQVEPLAVTNFSPQPEKPAAVPGPDQSTAGAGKNLEKRRPDRERPPRFFWLADLRPSRSLTTHQEVRST
jgi:hypothetical protein